MPWEKWAGDCCCGCCWAAAAAVTAGRSRALLLRLPLGDGGRDDSAVDHEMLLQPLMGDGGSGDSVEGRSGGIGGGRGWRLTAEWAE